MVRNASGAFCIAAGSFVLGLVAAVRPWIDALLQDCGSLEHQFDQHSGFGAREAYFLVDRLAEIRACHSFPGHRSAPLRGKPILMNYRRYSHARSMLPGRELTSAAARRPK